MFSVRNISIRRPKTKKIKKWRPRKAPTSRSIKSGMAKRIAQKNLSPVMRRKRMRLLKLAKMKMTNLKMRKAITGHQVAKGSAKIRIKNVKENPKLNARMRSWIVQQMKTNMNLKMKTTIWMMPRITKRVEILRKNPKLIRNPRKKIKNPSMTRRIPNRLTDPKSLRKKPIKQNKNRKTKIWT